MSIKNLIFDWSGTLSNDLSQVYEACMQTFRKFGKQPISLEEFRSEFVLPYMNFWHKYFPSMTKEEQDRLFAEALVDTEQPELYDGVKQELEALKKSGLNLIVISSYPHDALITQAADYGCSQYFSEINGGIHDKTQEIAEIMQRNGFLPHETAYVGDMVHDVKAGKKAGVLTVAIDWGYQTRERLLTSNPDKIISNISELRELL